jgi:predicted MPP superfamily phosphohydrolase
MNKRRFIHISDIHFNRNSPTFGFDPDENLRELFAQDIGKMRNKIGAVDAILVSGDVAYAGKKSEYDLAAKWLERLCDLAGCRHEDVIICPGNHDVDQSTIKANSLIEDGQCGIRGMQTSFEKNAALNKRLQQSAARDLLYQPLAAFNEFAARYGCEFFADGDRYVRERDFRLAGGSILRIRSLNTTLLSGLADRKESLFLGERAYTLSPDPNVIYLVMAHHPPSWLADQREVENSFDRYARVQLYGSMPFRVELDLSTRRA